MIKLIDITIGVDMFIQNLDKKQQSVLLFLAREVIDVDEQLHDSEKEILTILTNQAESSASPEAIELKDLAAIFDTNISRSSLLLELIGVAHADGDYNPDENALIKKYANALDVTEEKLLKLENWVSNQLALSFEVQELLA